MLSQLKGIMMKRKRSSYKRKLENKSGTYGKAAGFKSCCAHERKAVEVDYRNNKRKANAPVKKGGPRMTKQSTVTYAG